MAVPAADEENAFHLRRLHLLRQALEILRTIDVP
jgi:hypothetical protein